MLWSVFLVAAAMLVCCGPHVSGILSREECGNIMFDEWFSDKYGRIEITREDQEFLDGCWHRLKLRPRADIDGTRQECRTLSDERRRSLFGCFNVMARSGRMGAFEAMHRQNAAVNAHFGPCFGGWHRTYLALMEEAMRTVCGNPTLCLCYWDVTLDSALPNPCESAIFTDTYFGNENGPVTSGPYANKPCLQDCRMGQGGPPILYRQCGAAALATEGSILQIINARGFEVFSIPSAPGPRPISMFEATHGECHMFVSGQMARLPCSPCDFMFFFLHSYFDMLLDTNLRRRGANIDREYPGGNVPQFHRAFDRTLPPPLNETCAGALRLHPDATPYAPPVVSCNDHDACGSKALWCNRGRCNACVRGGARMIRGWPDRACFIEGCDNPVNGNGACRCGGPPRQKRSENDGDSD